jgi:hypothetical protein
MDMKFLFAPAPGQIAAAQKELAACNRLSAPYGLVLSAQQLQTLTQCRFAALKAAGRVDLGGGILPALIAAFCDSPYLAPATYEADLAALQEMFYTFKTDCRERMSDDELLHAMRLLFDGRAQGSLEYLAGATPELLADAAQGILPRGGPEWQEEDDEESDDDSDG